MEETKYLEEWAYIHIKPKVSKSRSNHFGSSVMAILAHFCNKKTWSPTFTFHKLVNSEFRICFCKLQTVEVTFLRVS